MSAEEIQPKMTDDQYTHVQNVITAITNTVCNLDLDGFLERLFETEALGPQEDPKMWEMVEPRFRQVRECADKLVELRDLVNRHADEEREEAERFEKDIKAIEAQHEEGSATTAQPVIPNDPSFIIRKEDDEF